MVSSSSIGGTILVRLWAGLIGLGDCDRGLTELTGLNEGLTTSGEGATERSGRAGAEGAMGAWRAEGEGEGEDEGAIGVAAEGEAEEDAEGFEAGAWHSPLTNDCPSGHLHTPPCKNGRLDGQLKHTSLLLHDAQLSEHCLQTLPSRYWFLSQEDTH